MRKIPEDARIEPGWALARVGDGGWWPAIERGLARRPARRRDRGRARRRPARGRDARRVGHQRSRRHASGGVLDRARRARRRGARRRLTSPLIERTGGPTAAARDGERRSAGGQRARRLHGRRPRRPPGTGVLLDDRRLLRLDARDGRRPAAQGRRRGGGAGHPCDADVTRARTPIVRHGLHHRARTRRMLSSPNGTGWPGASRAAIGRGSSTGSRALSTMRLRRSARPVAPWRHCRTRRCWWRRRRLAAEGLTEVRELIDEVTLRSRELVRRLGVRPEPLSSWCWASRRDNRAQRVRPRTRRWRRRRRRR